MPPVLLPSMVRNGSGSGIPRAWGKNTGASDPET